MLSSIKILLFFLCYSITCTAQLNNAAQQIFYAKRVIQKYHIKPKPIDDSFSLLLFKDYINELDEDKIIFTQTHLAQLKKYELTIDDDINIQKTNFLQTIIAIYKNQLSTITTYLKELALIPQDFSIDEKLLGTKQFAENDIVLKNRWRLYLKSNIVEAIYNYAIKSNNKTKLTDKQWFATQEAICRKKEALKLQTEISQILNPIEGFEKNMINTFCEKMTEIFDAHTNYFTTDGLKEFDNHLSGGQKILFGFSIEENEKNEIIIGDLVPGSPAYKSGQIHINDVLLKITLPNNESFDAKDASIKEVIDYLNNASGTVTLTVKKNDGEIKTITLTEAKIASEDGLVQSFILKENIQLGYIALPDFYVGTDAFANQGCAADVAKEIIKLKKENIQGLILDLRYNGGGSLEEALDLAGMFIDDGALLLTKNSFDTKVTILRDNNRGTIYDGPLMILVNGYSASASEIFAGIMQDYNRAFIVGNKTFGKHIGQIVIPLDTIGDLMSVMQKTTMPQYGYVKVTTSQYNLLNGNSLQCKGVVPQIELPQVFVPQMSEATLPHPIYVDALKKNVVYTALPPLPLQGLNELSKTRIAQNKALQKVIATIKQSKSNTANDLPLKLSSFLKLTETKTTTENTDSLPKLYAVDNTSFYKERIKVNESLRKNNNAIQKYIEQDFYIREAFEIYKNILKIK